VIALVSVNQCPQLTLVAGQVTYSNPLLHPDTVANFTCNPSYVLRGSAAANCRLDGTWDDAPLPVCIAQCPALTSPHGIDVNYTDPERLNGSVATLSCRPGFLLSGSPSLTCLSNATWDKSTPICTGNIIC
jgi:Sushi repeat (SCR repeat)